jgi:hypothetical protein
MKKPNLFIVGAPKSGTSTLWSMLKEHKDIFFSTNPVKEINYFSYDELVHNSYYKDYKVKSEQDYLKVFKRGQSVKYLVDGSVSYFAYPSIPKKLYDFNSEAKIIIIVRDPILRAFSHYNMDKRMGYATEPFSEYLINKDNKYDKYIHQYIENSMYDKHINNYLEYFDESKVFVMRLEKLDSDFDRLCDFLEIDNSNSSSHSQIINASRIPTNIISKTLQHNRYMANVFKKILPKKIIRFFAFLFYKKAEHVQLKDEDRALLQQYLKEDYNNFNKKYKI